MALKDVILRLLGRFGPTIEAEIQKVVESVEAKAEAILGRLRSASHAQEVAREECRSATESARVAVARARDAWQMLRNAEAEYHAAKRDAAEAGLSPPELSAEAEKASS